MTEFHSCATPGCTRLLTRYAELCSPCYQRKRRDERRGRVARPKEKRYCWMGDGRPAKAYGFCELHWQRIEATGSPEPGKWSREHPHRCVVPGCLRPHRSMGLCARHYRREFRNGHPLWRTRAGRRISPQRPWTADRVTDLSIVDRHNEKGLHQTP